MRLILALAAHFKPGSVRQSPQVASPATKKIARTPSAAAAAADAAAAIGEASRAAASIGRQYNTRNRYCIKAAGVTASYSVLFVLPMFFCIQIIIYYY